MAGVMRSNTGCWTCRVRRKKCDEKGLPCMTCSSLGLLCDGYGPRPAWFDGGHQEKAQAAAFKAVVRCASLAKRRNRWQENCIANVGNCASETVRESPTSQKQSSRTGSFELSIAGSAFETSPHELTRDWEKTFQLLEFSEELPPETFELDDNDIASDYLVEPNLNVLPTPSLTSVASSSNEVQFEFFSNSTDCAPPAAQQKARSYFDAQPGSLIIPPVAGPECFHTAMQQLLTPVTHLAPQKALPILSGLERAALQYYIEVVFPSWLILLPFEVARDECKRTIEASQQLRSALQRIISLSARLQCAELRRFGLGYPEPAIPDTLDHGPQFPMISLNGDGTDECGLLHVLLAQVSEGGKHWPGLLEQLSCSKPVSNCSQKQPSHIRRAILSYVEVLASTLTGAEPQFARRHLAIHDSQAVMGYVTGVEFWLLDCLIQIIQLRRWKREQHSKGSLSMVELVTRSLTIEQEIQKRRQEPPQHGEGNDHARSAFMQVYASAVAVFLQCTASDARPQIVEIQKEVSNTIQALRNLPQVSLLKRLAWPVCIAASMTIQPAQQAFFRGLFQRVVEAWGREENISKALETASECWRLQGCAAHGETYDWTDAMKSRGNLLLLF